MNSPHNRTLPAKDRVTPAELEQALMHWDELDKASLRVLAEHPHSRLRLAGLRKAEEWLEAGGRFLEDQDQASASAQSAPAGPCPSAEQLFDFADGSARAQEVELHLSQCEDCAGLIGSLASRPPSPLSLVSDEDLRSELIEPIKQRNASWVPLLVAASLVGITLLPILRENIGAQGPSPFPSHALVRGNQSGAILFPKGRVLAGNSGAQPQFEVPAVDQASVYRIEVFRFTGSAFEQGEQILALESASPLLNLASEQRLGLGHYSWQAFAEVRGLQQPVGDGGEFKVVHEAQLASDLEALLVADTLAAESALPLIHQLEARGFASDARQLARRLPASPERDAYLRGPGR